LIKTCPICQNDLKKSSGSATITYYVCYRGMHAYSINFNYKEELVGELIQISNEGGRYYTKYFGLSDSTLFAEVPLGVGSGNIIIKIEPKRMPYNQEWIDFFQNYSLLS